MVGKKNIVFGFIYLVFTASLGLVMADMYNDFGARNEEKKVALTNLEQMVQEIDFHSPEDITKANANSIVAINNMLKSEAAIDRIKGGAHSHGNLESVLNIIAGLTLCFIAAAKWLKQLISWLFIIGAVMHSGMLYLGRVLGYGWAESALGTGIGPFALLIGLGLLGIVACFKFSSEIIKD